MYSGNENEKDKGKKWKKKINRIVSKSNTDLTLKKMEVCQPEKQNWVVQIPAKTRLISAVAVGGHG